MDTSEGFDSDPDCCYSLIGMALVFLLPTPADLPTRTWLIAILVFAVIISITSIISRECLCDRDSHVFGLGLSPNPAKPEAVLGTANALRMGLAGFSTPRHRALVAGAMFLSAGMIMTGLDKRIALMVIWHIGIKSNRLVIGVIFVFSVF